ncbi:MAG: class B sortase [Firmicutes bacterium]|nr:class B sortase [Bacillota bacterium]
MDENEIKTDESEKAPNSDTTSAHHKPIKRRHAARDYTPHTAPQPAPESSNIFAESVENATADELGEYRKKRGSARRVIALVLENLVLIISSAVFIYCMISLALLITEQLDEGSYYDEILDGYTLSSLKEEALTSSSGTSTLSQMDESEAFVAGVSQPDTGIKIEEKEYNEEVELMKAKIASLSAEYPDVYGWIYIEDTCIDYPIVRGDDNTFYLNHAYTGESLSIGSIFADYRMEDYILDNYNIILYGHNSSTGYMFADINKYFGSSEEFFNTHYIYVYTTTGLYVFEPFNLTMFSYDFNYFRTYFATGADFVDFAYTMQSYSMYSKELSFNVDDRIITLSTCTNTGIKTMRTCLQAKLIDCYE